MEINKYIGSKIREFREKRNLTQDDLAEYLKTTAQTISRYEIGDRKTPQDVLFKLANYFNVSINTFFPITNYKFGTEIERILQSIAAELNLSVDVCKSIFIDIKTFEEKNLTYDNIKSAIEEWLFVKYNENLNNVPDELDLLFSKNKDILTDDDKDYIKFIIEKRKKEIDKELDGE